MSVYCPYCMSAVENGKFCPTCGKEPAAYRAESHHFPPGSLLKERYLIGRVLGEGGFGITYLGLDTRLERRVAIKEYFPTSFVQRETSVSLDVTCYTTSGRDFYEKGREQFLQEAKTMARLENISEIVRVLDFFPANNTAYIIMDFLEGSTLKELTAKLGCIPADEMLKMLEPVLRGMDAMHKAGVIHRDISPDNLMQLKNGRVMLMDFGCAKEIEGGRTMTVTLKHGFAPMEQYTGYGQGPWSDVYSICATVYYCLTGKVPPQSVERSELDQDPLVPPTALGAALSNEQEQAILKGLAVRARNRWQKVADLYGALYGKTMEGLPWTPPVEQPSQEKGNTEYIAGAFKHNTDKKDIGKTEYAGTNTSSDFPNGTGKGGMSKTAKGVVAAACCAIIAGATFFMGRPNQPPVDPDSQNKMILSADRETQTESGEDEEKMTGTDDDLGVFANLPSGETDETENNQTAEPETEPQESETSEPLTEAPTVPETKPQETPAPTTARQQETTKAPAVPTMEELDQAAETYKKNKQYKEAEACYRQMRTLGYVDDAGLGDNMWNIGYRMELGGDYTSAAAIWEECVRLNNSASTMWYLGQLYEKYLGDAETGFQWYLKSAQNNYEPAYIDVGRCYKDGIGTGRNLEEALSWLEAYVSFGYAQGTGTARTMIAEIQAEQEAAQPSTVTNQPFTMITSKFSVSGVYTGEWKDGAPNGKGTMTIQETNDRWDYGDTLWSADWVNGLIEGYGQWRSAVDGAYDGNFSSGLKSGYGKMWFNDGTVFDGQWSGGDFVG